MTQDTRYDILFEPVKIGPVTAKNRFYQVPHCTGMGYLRPRMLAEMRATKAAGGWGVVCSEYNSIHPSSDDLTHVSASLWDDSDIRAHRLMTDKVHEHGALAGAELWYSGRRSANMMTREVALDLECLPNAVGHPFQTLAMDKRTSVTFGAGTAKRRCGREMPALTLYMSMQRIPICYQTFLTQKPTPEAIKTMEAWKTASGWCGS